MGYRDELEALRARLAAVEHERDSARAEAERLKQVLMSRRRAAPPGERTQEQLPARWRSIPGGEPTPVTLINESARKLDVCWLDYEGRTRSAGTLVAGGRMRTQSYVGHCWRFADGDSGEVLRHVFVRIEAGEPVLVYRDERSA